MSNRTKSLIFDTLQISSGLFIVFTGPITASHPLLLLLEALAILIIIEAAYEMRQTRFYRVPDVGKQRALVTSGVYKYVRNPMYLSQLLFGTALVMNSFSLLRLIVLSVLLVNFLFKIRYEEDLLTTHFKEYKKYKKSSWRLIPFVY